MKNKVPRVYEKKYKKYIGKLYQEEQTKINRTKKKNCRIINTTFFLSFIPLILSLFLYEDTFIDVKIILIVYTFFGLISAYISSNFFNNSEVYKSLFYKLFINFICAGSLFSFSLLGINYLSFKNKLVEKQFTIIRKGSKAGATQVERTPTVDINHHGIIKSISFSPKDAEKVKGAIHIKLTLQEGNLGFDFIKSKKII
ncbi:hypothetical protein [Flammeovirga sp. SJP92]|uniref:hypothetical protein n=1 Tax=Flammeovirga sp. SJP92 TaxID=1775430 RepID=UPI00078765E6|nr:hypothetical protein [Flammeovirga sp. SJP92]KXX70879.1 hypothetical protein AVL50_10935 [Flammeovirga sp. SJP92]